MSDIAYYVLHDPVDGLEAQITNFDPEAIAEAVEKGLVIIGIHEDGTRERVQPEDVTEPEPLVETISIAQPAYVDVRMRAVYNTFEALGEELGLVSEESGELVAEEEASDFQLALSALAEFIEAEDTEE